MVKVAVLGAAGGIGQPLSLLLKQNPHITHLALYDIVNVHGVGADIGHINTKARVTSHLGKEELATALKGSHTVIIPAGVPRKPGMVRDDLFRINAGIVKDLASGIAEQCPKALVLVISNPVNSTVPIVAGVLKKAGVYDPRRVFGVTTLDVVRASEFVAQLKNTDPSAVSVPVVGGHSGDTIVPLLSQATPPLGLSDDEAKQLTLRIQFGGEEVVKAKDGAGSATLSMAFAAARFAGAVLDASVGGKKGIVEPSFVSLDADPEVGPSLRADVDGLEFFATRAELGVNGVTKLHPLGSISEYEKQVLVKAKADLKNNIEKGTAFVQQQKL